MANVEVTTTSDRLVDLAGLFEAAPKAMWVHDGAGAVLEMNELANRHFGHGLPLAPAAPNGPLSEAPGPGDNSVIHHRSDGTMVTVRLTTSPVSISGRPAFLVVADEVEGTTAEAEAHLLEAQQLARVGTWKWDLVTGDLDWSDELIRIFGLQRSSGALDLAGYLARVHPEDTALVEAALHDTIRTSQALDFQHRILTPAGEARWVRCRGRARSDEQGRLVRVLGACLDITDQKRAEEDLTRQALHDGLTGLPNRTLFLDRLQHALLRLGRSPGAVGVLFVDLDRFKLINDSLGHSAGDALLCEVAARLTALMRPQDTVARFGGDEFAILCEDLADEQAAAQAAARIIEALAAPMEASGQVAVTGASIGISVTRDPGASAEAMIGDADSAMYRAKEWGRGRYVIFDTEIRERATARLNRGEELRQALEEEQFRVYFQPVVDVRDESSVGVEALVRWEHPELGLIEPSEFIDIAEETGMIIPLGEWVLTEACRQVASWPRRPGHAAPTLSINLSARQLTQASVIDAVWGVLQETGLDPAGLVLEITESVLMEDVESSIEALLGLKKLGVRIAIDDFGTGYSSLSYLRRFPVDVVKIDRSFVAGLGVDPAADAIVAAVVNLSHALGLRVVAEGVETEEQLLAVRALRCDHAQGFYWSPPLPAEDLGRWSEAARPAMATVPVDLLDLLRERTAALRTTTGRPVVLQAPPKLGSAVAELRAVKNVLDHLLGNAVTFSDSDRPVVVSAASDRRWVRVSVTDFGIGMSPEESTRCFEQFWQAEGRVVGGPSGTGIGLFVVRSLVDAMGGHVGVKSVKGKGSTFTVALPRSARAPGRRGPAGAINPGVSEDSTIREFMRQIGVPNRRGA